MTQNFAGNTFTDNQTQISLDREEVFVFPASFAQHRLWFLDRLVPGNPFYNVGCAVRLTGSLNLKALERTFNEIVRRHETLRTAFALVDGQPVQIVTPTLTVSVPVTDLRHLPAAERDTQARQLATAEVQRPFNLAAGSLMRVKLLQLDAAEYVLLLNLHHIVADGWSIGVLIREIGVLYTAFIAQKRSPLPDLSIQYADFAEWQREWLQDSVLETQLAYWRQQLRGMPVLNLPTDRPRPAVPTYRGSQEFIAFPPALSEALETLSRQQGVTLFITLLAAFQTLLWRYTGQKDVAIGSPIANRNRSEIEGLIGFFVNSLVLRTDLSGNPTFLELLNQVKEVALGAYAHQDLPFEKLVEDLHPDRDLSRNPLFQVSFSLQNTPIQVLELPGLNLSALEFDAGTAKLDLEVNLWQHGKSLKGQVVYSSDLFDGATIVRMLGQFQTLLKSIAGNPEQRLSELQILTEAEQNQLLVEFNRPQSKLHNKVSKIERCFHHLFEAQVERTPDAVAVVFQSPEFSRLKAGANMALKTPQNSPTQGSKLKAQDSVLTYRELNSRANQLAHHLQKLGVKPEVLVGICLERSVEMIVGVLGILKAGGAYLPLDPTYPQERLEFMLADAQVFILLTNEKQPITGGMELKHRPNSTGKFEINCQSPKRTLVCLDKHEKIISGESKENPTSSVTTDHLAYIIYTSGSTGKPKGVLIEHRGLLNMAEAQVAAFNLQPNHRVLQFSSLSFDASIFEIVMALRTGATLYLAKKESLLPGESFSQFLRNHEITHITLPPAVLAVLPAKKLPALQAIICAGEICSQDIVKSWAAGRQFFNAYGPTEATVWATIAEIKDNNKKPPIGRPIAKTQIYILNEYLQPAPIGTAGELYIAGDGVARGYLNRPELTAERFIPNPFFKETKGEFDLKLTSGRLYKTGDLARYNPNGNIEFLGRIDEQVKIRGFRIELGEIEAVLRQHPSIKETVAVALEDKSGNKRIVAYIVSNCEFSEEAIGTGEIISKPASTNPKSNIENFKASDLCQFLKDQLPEYMVPSAFVVLDSLPVTPNGKVNRRALPAPDGLTNFPRQKAFVAPRTATESALAKIWAEVLQLERVSINDNFFDLGGDSLLAIRLIDKVHKQFERELPLSSLFLTPTVESLATTLSAKKDPLKWSPLVAIQPAGSNPPFFCVHPIFGVVFPYCELANSLSKNQPFYGLQPLGIDSEKTPLTRIEDMAVCYIEALREVQPNGPYFLGGWSFGGLVAFEMAQQLQRSGQEVALLALFDTSAPAAGNQPSLWDAFKFLFTTVSRSIWPFVIDYLYLTKTSKKRQSEPSTGNFIKLNKLIQPLKTQVSWKAIFEKAVIANILPKNSGLQMLNELTVRSMFRVFKANSQATLNYMPQVYPNKITLFKSSEQAQIAHQDPTGGWSQFAGSGVNVHLVPGNHLTMIRSPNVQVLADRLMQCFKK